MTVSDFIHKIVYTTKDKLNEVPITNGYIIFCRDEQTVYFDFENSRQRYDKFIFLSSDSERTTITGINDTFYFCKDTRVLWFFSYGWYRITLQASDFIDTTLTVSGKAADAKVVGDKLAEITSTATTWENIEGKPETFEPSSHNHSLSEVTNLQTELDGKADVEHIHDITSVTGLQTALDNKSDSDHNHDELYYTETEIDTKLAGKANSSHGTHIPSGGTSGQVLKVSSDGSYAWGNDNNTTYSTGSDTSSGLTKLYTETGDNTDGTMTQAAINTALGEKADTNHAHDDRYYTETEVDSKLNGKANTSHGTHVSYSTTEPVMDGTASVGTASTVARSDHKHPTDTSRAAAEHNHTKSEITDFPESLKNPTALTLQLNGVTDQIYDGSSAKTFNVTPAAIGASASGHTHSSYVNQNAFSNVKVGDTTVAADTTTDTLTLVAGSNVTITPDATNDQITIAAKDTTYSVATQSDNGLLSSTDKTKLDGIATGANKYTLPVATSSALGGVKSGGDVTINTEGVISVNDDSHNHTIANVDNLQTALDGKVPTSRTINGKALSANITLSAGDVGADPSGSADSALAAAKEHTKTSIANLIGSADETMDTLGEIQTAMKENANVVEALDAAIGSKANTVDLTSHTGNTTVHTNATERTNWNKAYTHSQATHARADATKVADSDSNGNILINDQEVNVYTHPSHTAKTAGLYKITVDGSGHVSNATAVAKADITALGIPSTDTTYNTGTESTAGITKLYTTAGTNTDGTMTQAAIKTALDAKATTAYVDSAIEAAIGAAIAASY